MSDKVENNRKSVQAPEVHISWLAALAAAGTGLLTGLAFTESPYRWVYISAALVIGVLGAVAEGDRIVVAKSKLSNSLTASD